MTTWELRQFHSLLREVEEEERRRNYLAVYSLFDDDHDVIDRYREQLRTVNQWIARIEDSMTRRAFRLRYVDGLPWAAVSQRLGYTCEAGARKLCQRYLLMGDE